ncbi:hypothetical protein ABZP36_006960 [Zizania latifolia]
MAPTIPPDARAISSDTGSESGPVVISSDGSAPGPIALSSSSSDEEPASKKPRRECWLFCDEVKILTALAAQRTAGTSRSLPSPRKLFDELQHRLNRKRFTASDLAKKVAHLKGRFLEELSTTTGTRRRQESGDTTLFDLSKKVWPELLPAPVVVISSSSSSSRSSSPSSSSS